MSREASGIEVRDGVVVTEPAHLAEAIELLQQERSAAGRREVVGLRIRDDSRTPDMVCGSSRHAATGAVGAGV
jgi:hypothetical protein